MDVQYPSISPDGKWIYVQPSHRNIWRVLTAGGRLERVTDFPESGLFLEEQTLSPDGRAPVYSRGIALAPAAGRAGSGRGRALA